MIKVKIQWEDKVEVRTQTYEFATVGEAKSFWLGMMEGGGWKGATLIDAETDEILNGGAPEDLAAGEYWKLNGSWKGAVLNLEAA
jgi:hypothetical protein